MDNDVLVINTLKATSVTKITGKYRVASLACYLERKFRTRKVVKIYYDVDLDVNPFFPYNIVCYRGFLEAGL